MADTQTHSYVRAEIAAALRKRGWLVTSYAPGHAGVADLICCSPRGIYMEIEVKTGNAGQSPLQKVREQKVEAVGGYYVVARDTDWREIFEPGRLEEKALDSIVASAQKAYPK